MLRLLSAYRRLPGVPNILCWNIKWGRNVRVSTLPVGRSLGNHRVQAPVERAAHLSGNNEPQISTENKIYFFIEFLEQFVRWWRKKRREPLMGRPVDSLLTITKRRHRRGSIFAHISQCFIFLLFRCAPRGHQFLLLLVVVSQKNNKTHMFAM